MLFSRGNWVESHCGNGFANEQAIRFISQLRMPIQSITYSWRLFAGKLSYEDFVLIAFSQSCHRNSTAIKRKIMF